MPQADLDTAWLRFMLNAVLASLTVDPDRSVEDLTVERQAAAAMLGAFQVRNAIEAAFAAQAVAACHAALECFRRAALMNASYPETGRVFATATSLSRMGRARSPNRPITRLKPSAGVISRCARSRRGALRSVPPRWRTRSRRCWRRLVRLTPCKAVDRPG